MGCDPNLAREAMLSGSRKAFLHYDFMMYTAYVYFYVVKSLKCYVFILIHVSYSTPPFVSDSLGGKAKTLA